LEYLEDDEAGKCRGEEVALGKTILLDEKVEGANGLVEEALVWGFIHEVKVVDQAVEDGFGFNFVAGSFS
jgi:hypothetical protein